jgi:SAM-dependent methyltransferase
VSIAELYHAHQGSHLEDLPFWSWLAARARGPILELGCGSGRLTLPLGRDGHRLVGVDRDRDMLAVLRHNGRDVIGRSVHVFQGDVTRIHLNARFPLVIFPCNTLSTFSALERDRLYRCVRAHLGSGGLLAVSMPNPTRLAALSDEGEPEIEEIVTHPRSGQPVQVSSVWKRAPEYVLVSWHYDHLLPDGRVERQTLTARHALVPLEDHNSELSAAGLEVVDAFGDFDRSPYRPDAAYLILTARLNPGF